LLALYRTNIFEDNSKRFSEATLYPDLRLRCKETRQEFFVEAKFRSGFNQKTKKLEWSRPDQLQRYKNIDNNELPVFFALGIGGNPADPE